MWNFGGGCQDILHEIWDKTLPNTIQQTRAKVIPGIIPVRFLGFDDVLSVCGISRESMQLAVVG